MTHLVIALSALIILAAVVVILVWRQHRAAVPREVEWPDIAAAARQGGYQLILAKELAAAYLLDPENFLLVDTREPEEYRAGHIRGAVNFPLKPGRWARRRAAKALAALLGGDRRRAVVFY